MKRRQLLKQAGILGLFSMLGSFRLNAQDLVPGLGVHAADGYYKFQLGKLEMLVITDGHLYIHPVQPIFAPGIEKRKVDAAMVDSIPKDAVDAAINVLVIKKEKRIILIDTGSGALMGDQAGRFLKNLNLAGITAEEVTDIFVTHLHGDHIGGIIDPKGDLVFKNASYYLSHLEYHFWMSENPDFSQSKNEGSNADSITLARNIVSAIKDKLILYHFGETILDCIQTELAEGHTPGHPVLTIFSDNQAMRHMVDAVHTMLLISHPEWGTQWDVNFQKGISTRKRILEEQFISKGLTMSCHLPWPGLGYVTKEGERYGWKAYRKNTTLMELSLFNDEINEGNYL